MNNAFCPSPLWRERGGVLYLFAAISSPSPFICPMCPKRPILLFPLPSLEGRGGWKVNGIPLFEKEGLGEISSV